MSDVSRETRAKLDAYAARVIAENDRQNLISRSTVADFERRHLLDSLQLLALAPRARNWLDIGSGAGLPGIPIAIAGGGHVILVEPRCRRAEFLANIVVDLGIDAEVHACRLEALATRVVDVIAARAVGSLDVLFAMAHRFAHDGTVWLLPKGKSAQAELVKARKDWQGDFRIVPSVTDAGSGIIVARSVKARAGR